LFKGYFGTFFSRSGSSGFFNFSTLFGAIVQLGLVGVVKRNEVRTADITEVTSADALIISKGIGVHEFGSAELLFGLKICACQTYLNG